MPQPLKAFQDCSGEGWSCDLVPPTHFLISSLLFSQGGSSCPYVIMRFQLNQLATWPQSHPEGFQDYFAFLGRKHGSPHSFLKEKGISNSGPQGPEDAC